MLKKNVRLKKFTNSANELPIHKYRKNRKIYKCKTNQFGKKYTSPANEFLLLQYTVETIGS